MPGAGARHRASRRSVCLAIKYGVNSIPRVLIFKGSEQPRERVDGLVHEKELVKAINRVLESA